MVHSVSTKSAPNVHVEFPVVDLSPNEQCEATKHPAEKKQKDQIIEMMEVEARQESILNEHLPITKTATDGRKVDFFYREVSGLTVVIDERELNPSQLPTELRKIKSRRSLENYLESSYLVLRGRDNPSILIHGKGRGGVARPFAQLVSSLIGLIDRPMTMMIGGRAMRCVIQQFGQDIVIEAGNQARITLDRAGEVAILTGTELINLTQERAIELIRITNGEINLTLENISLRIERAAERAPHTVNRCSRESGRGFGQAFAEGGQFFCELLRIPVAPYAEMHSVSDKYIESGLQAALNIIRTIANNDLSKAEALYKYLLKDVIDKSNIEKREREIDQIISHIGATRSDLDRARTVRPLIVSILNEEGAHRFDTVYGVRAEGNQSTSSQRDVTANLTDLAANLESEEYRLAKRIAEESPPKEATEKFVANYLSQNRKGKIKRLLTIGILLRDEFGRNDLSSEVYRNLFDFLKQKVALKKGEAFFTLVKEMKQDNDLFRHLQKNQSALLGVICSEGTLGYSTFADRIETLCCGDDVLCENSLKNHIRDNRDIFHLGMALKRKGRHGEAIVARLFPEKVSKIILNEGKGYCFRMYNQKWGTLYAATGKSKYGDHNVRVDHNGYDHPQSDWMIKYDESRGAFPFRLYNRHWGKGNINSRDWNGEAVLFTARDKSNYGDQVVRVDPRGYNDERSNWSIKYAGGKCPFRLRNRFYGEGNSNLFAARAVDKYKCHHVRLDPRGFEDEQSNWDIVLNK